MTSYTREQAREHLYATLFNTWDDLDAGWRSLVADDEVSPAYTASPQIEWDNREPSETDGMDKPILFVYVRHFNEQGTGVGGLESQGGGRSRVIRRHQGFVLVRVYSPQDGGLKTGDRLAYVVKSAFAGKRGFAAGNGISFRSVRVTEVGLVKGRYEHLVTADFEYDEIISTGA